MNPPQYTNHRSHCYSFTGRYGFKRFLRDGYKTAVEDGNKRYYRPAEIKTFDGIECEWPIFFAYMVIDSVYKGNQKKV